LIEETEYGGTATSGGPSQTYGMMSSFLCLTTCYMTWDTPGSFNGNGHVPPYTGANPPPQPQATSGNHYSGGNGYTNRITVNAGSSAGASVTGEQTWMSVNKVMSSLSDTTFTTASFQPDSNHFGASGCGAFSCSVLVKGLNNTSYSTLRAFTPTLVLGSTHNVYWLLADLNPGSYNVTVGGTPVTGSPFTVGAGDGTIYFSTSGTPGSVVLSQLGSITNLSGNVSITGSVPIIH